MSTSQSMGRLRGADCPCRGATLARLVQPAVLALLAAGGLHGYVIVQRAARLPTLRGHRPDPTGVYRVLKAMAQRGLLAATWDASAKGPAKCSYALTPAGRACLTEWVVTLQAYQRALAALLAQTRRAAGRTRTKGCCCA